ncbi:MAG: hypothetical protein KF729_27915 [Sandaracinaceae bacterium]|nr:hypothetical protein [Sandaracinaceae bacterium]
MSRFDVLKSLVRGAAKASAERVGKLRSVAGLREAFAHLRARQAMITEAGLARAISHGIAGASGVSVSLRDGRAVIDVAFEQGAPLVVAVIPEETRFAPRGAKEVLFRVEPPELTGDARAREIVGAVAAAIARALWGPVLGERREGEHALVDREGARLRADLRSVPSVRAALEGSALAPALDVVSIGGFAIADRALAVTVALPFPAP